MYVNNRLKDLIFWNGGVSIYSNAPTRATVSTVNAWRVFNRWALLMFFLSSYLLLPPFFPHVTKDKGEEKFCGGGCAPQHQVLRRQTRRSRRRLGRALKLMGGGAG
jgi:hypothetical protein